MSEFDNTGSLGIEDKQDHPQRLKDLAGTETKYYFSAAELDKMRRATEELFQTKASKDDLVSAANGFILFANEAAANTYFTNNPPAEDVLFKYTDAAASKADFYRRASDNTTQVLKERSLTDADKAVTLDPNDTGKIQTGKTVGDYIQSKQDQRLDSEDRFVVITTDPAKLTEINTINHALLKFKPKGNFRPEAKYSINEVVNANILKSFTVVQDIGGIQLNIAKYEVAQTEFDTAVKSLTVPEFNNSGITFDITIDWGRIGLNDFDNVTPVTDYYINPLIYREDELLLNVFRDGITSGANYQKVFDIEKAITSFELTGKVNLNAKYSIAAVRNEASVRLIVINETIDAVRTEVVRYEVSQGSINTSKEVIDYTQGNFTLKATIDWSLIQNMVLTLFYEDKWVINSTLIASWAYKKNNEIVNDISVNESLGNLALDVEGVENLNINGWNLVGDEIQSTQNGYNYSARLDPVYQEDRFVFEAVFKSTAAGDFEAAMGKRDLNRGTVVSIAREGADSFIKVSRLSLNSPTEYLPLRQTLPFDLDQNIEYKLIVEKNAFDIDVTLISSDGYSYNFSFVDPENVGTFWGRPYVYPIVGSITCSYFNFYYPQPNNTTAAIVGDSFIEGYTVYANNDEKYAALIQAKMAGDLAILGKGGETTTSVLTRVYEQIDAFRFAKYFIIALGTNDTDFATYQTNINAMVAYVKSYGITPILVTITPRNDSGDNYTFMNAVNTWVRGLGELYVDVNRAVTVPGDETTWKAGYRMADLVHPELIAHEAIYRKFLFDVPFLFKA